MELLGVLFCWLLLRVSGLGFSAGWPRGVNLRRRRLCLHQNRRGSCWRLEHKFWGKREKRRKRGTRRMHLTFWGARRSQLYSTLQIMGLVLIAWMGPWHWDGWRKGGVFVVYFSALLCINRHDYRRVQVLWQQEAWESVPWRLAKIGLSLQRAWNAMSLSRISFEGPASACDIEVEWVCFLILQRVKYMMIVVDTESSDTFTWRWPMSKNQSMRCFPILPHDHGHDVRHRIFRHTQIWRLDDRGFKQFFSILVGRLVPNTLNGIFTHTETTSCAYW